MELIVTTKEQLIEIIEESVTRAVASMAEPKDQRMSRRAVSDYLGVTPGTVDNIARIHTAIMPRHTDERGRGYFLLTQVDDYRRYRGDNF
ncbi:MAG: hypothetical protein R2828_29430 [Saprospiraceae bacterium]